MAALVWFRRNLRVAANPAIIAASAQPGQHFVFCLDAQYTGSWLGVPRMGPHRARLLQENLQALQQDLAARGAELIIARGEPEDILPALARQCYCNVVETQALPAWEEWQQGYRVGQALQAQGMQLYTHDDYTLFPPDQISEVLPRPLTSFSAFRRRIEPHLEARADQLRTMLSPRLPARFHSTPVTALSESAPATPLQLLPTSPVQIPGADTAVTDERTAWPFTGGRAAALKRLHHYLRPSGPVRHYHDTRNQLLGTDYSSKLSPWLNSGCLSPAEVLLAVREHEQHLGANKSTYWLQFELLWREFFQHLARQRGAGLFQGLAQRADVPPWSVSFHDWCQGTTGQAFVDANMRELLTTGYLSNRGRQNVASACIHELGADWRLGALWFESRLLDYDPGANYGNWQYIGGLTANPRGGSWFNLASQARRYDPDAIYTRHWLD